MDLAAMVDAWQAEDVDDDYAAVCLWCATLICQWCERCQCDGGCDCLRGPASAGG